MAKPDSAWIELLGARLHDWFEANLRKIGAAARAGLHPVEIGVSASPTLDLADQAAEIRVWANETGIPAHRGHIFGRRALCIDLLGDADIAEYLHRALIKHVRFGEDRCGRQRRDKSVLHAQRR